MAETTVAYHLSVSDHDGDGLNDFVLNRALDGADAVSTHASLHETVLSAAAR